MAYDVISADGHIDLIWLPPDLFTSQASGQMKERMPYVIEGENGPKWVKNVFEGFLVSTAIYLPAPSEHVYQNNPQGYGLPHSPHGGWDLGRGSRQGGLPGGASHGRGNLADGATN